MKINELKQKASKGRVNKEKPNLKNQKQKAAIISYYTQKREQEKKR